MLKKIAAGLLASLLSYGANPQLLCTLGSARTYKHSADQRPSRDAMQLAGQVNAAVRSICVPNCPSVMVLRNATAPNAILTVEAGQGKLVYSPAFFASVHDTFGDPGVVAIIAHEFGHALDDALGASWVQQSWTPELRADAWAGCALGKSALSATELQAALDALAKYPSPSHPGWTVRLPVIRAGYTGCGGGSANFQSGNARGRK